MDVVAIVRVEDACTCVAPMDGSADAGRCWQAGGESHVFQWLPGVVATYGLVWSAWSKCRWFYLCILLLNVLLHNRLYGGFVKILALPRAMQRVVSFWIDGLSLCYFLFPCFFSPTVRANVVLVVYFSHMILPCISSWFPNKTLYFLFHNDFKKPWIKHIALASMLWPEYPKKTQ